MFIVVSTRLDVTKEGTRSYDIIILHFVKREDRYKLPESIRRVTSGPVELNYFMRSARDDIQDIVEQLKQLTIQQSQLLQRLQTLSEDTGVNHPTPPPQVATTQHRAQHIPPDTIRPFAIGDRVRINNPGILQPHSGIIVKITPKRITVQAKSGSRINNIVRAHKNLTLE